MRRSAEHIPSIFWRLAVAWCLLLIFPAMAGAQLRRVPPSRTIEQVTADQPRSPVTRQLVIESVALSGNSRTSLSVALAIAQIAAGDPADPDAILAAAERLRQARLFQTVEVSTRPGNRPGQVQVVFEVEENRPHLRFGLGYEDYSGWYLIPLQLNLDNLSGRGEGFDLSTRFGYRLAGLVLSYRWPLRPSPNFWEIRLRTESQDRIYFFDQTEIKHPVSQSGIDLRWGHSLAPRLALESWLSLENADADSTAEVYRTRESRQRQQGDVLDYDELPVAIREDLAAGRQTRLGLALVVDADQGPGLRRRGIWGRAGGEGVAATAGNFARADLDCRIYTPLRRGAQLAVRGRAGVVSAAAPFFERYYLGGLYTVRGYPSQALSPPEGNLRFATWSAELRTAWIGPPENPRLVGLIFADLGMGWNSGNPDRDDCAAGAGYGLRLRMPWIGYLGMDVGRPFSASPVTEGFHLNLSLGWTF